MTPLSHLSVEKIFGWGSLLLSLSIIFAWFALRPRPARCQRFESRNIGSLRCRACHEKAYQTWKHSAHARAFEILPLKERKNPTCLRCHSLGLQPHLQGVQCESCHGGGLYYARSEVMKDHILAQAAGLKLVKGPKACLSCHQNSPKLRKFHYKTMWNKIKHGK